jgi:ribosomal protein L11 methyltransferase
LGTPRFPRVKVDVPEAEADLASAELFDLGATGIEVRDATTLDKGTEGKETLVASFDD